MLTHWGWVTHICVSKLTKIGSDNGLSPGQRQAFIWTNAGILLNGPCGTNFSENLIGIQTFSFKKMSLKMASAKWRPFCPGLNVLINSDLIRCGYLDCLLVAVLQYGRNLMREIIFHQWSAMWLKHGYVCIKTIYHYRTKSIASMDQYYVYGSVTF